MAATDRHHVRDVGAPGQPSSLPFGLRGVERHEIGERLGQGVRRRPVGERRPAVDRGDMDGVPGLVDQLGKLAETAVEVGGEYRRPAVRPGAIVSAMRPAAERGERDRDGRPRWSGVQVQLDAQLVEIGAQRRVDRPIDAQDAVVRQDLLERPLGGAGPPPPVPGLDRRLSGSPAGLDHGCPPGSEQRDDPPFDRLLGDAQRLGVGCDRRAARAPGSGRFPDQRSVGRPLTAIAVHDPPQRCHGQEQAPALGRIALGGEPAQHLEAGQRPIADADRLGGGRVAGLDAPPQRLTARGQGPRPAALILAGGQRVPRRDGEPGILGERGVDAGADRGQRPPVLVPSRFFTGLPGGFERGQRLAHRSLRVRRGGLEIQPVGGLAPCPGDIEPVPGVARGEVGALERREPVGRHDDMLPCPMDHRRSQARQSAREVPAIRARDTSPGVARSRHGAHLPRRCSNRHRLAAPRRYGSRPGARRLRHVPGRPG